MRARMKAGVLVLTAEHDGEREELGAWLPGHDDHAFLLTRQDPRTDVLRDLGPRLEACREPINVISTVTDPAVRLLSNLAATPFELHGRRYMSVEGFWQGLRFPDEPGRERVARLSGQEARQVGRDAPVADCVFYRGRRYRAGCFEHWSLMRDACWAKFTQHEAARQALLATGLRPLVHRVRRDSQTIPGVILAEILTKTRMRLLRGTTATGGANTGD